MIENVLEFIAAGLEVPYINSQVTIYKNIFER